MRHRRDLAWLRWLAVHGGSVVQRGGETFQAAGVTPSSAYDSGPPGGLPREEGARAELTTGRHDTSAWR